jgi:hypothetical protein
VGVNKIARIEALGLYKARKRRVGTEQQLAIEPDKMKN